MNNIERNIKRRNIIQLRGNIEILARDKKEIVYQMVMEKPFQSVSEIASALNMSRSTIYRYIEKKRQILV